jgi:hypothetical protein
MNLEDESLGRENPTMMVTKNHQKVPWPQVNADWFVLSQEIISF